jgi:hypothetical protein
MRMSPRFAATAMGGLSCLPEINEPGTRAAAAAAAAEAPPPFVVVELPRLYPIAPIAPLLTLLPGVRLALFTTFFRSQSTVQLMTAGMSM